VLLTALAADAFASALCGDESVEAGRLVSPTKALPPTMALSDVPQRIRYLSAGVNARTAASSMDRTTNWWSMPRTGAIDDDAVQEPRQEHRLWL
jgi:hypothetical protein